MPKKPKKPQKPQEVHTHLALKLTHHSVSVGARINYELRDPRLRHDQTRVFSFSTSIELVAVATWPEDRLGQSFTLSVYADYTDRESFSQVLRDRHRRGQDGAPEYRKIRGKCVPVYDLPHGIGFLQKDRGRQSWHGAAWIAPHVATEMLVLLSGNWRLYLSLHELRISRRRWIAGLSLQSADPAEE